ncbi:unnamed protein product [Allacma fusca]|uniref:Fatty acid hydroxylase domain-containing protein n=1 Tax=Allacma fusca TaxID=39272 RepID=A0A8J2J4B6_9HEXA|nr:unnamed protein product [Allacma fusca]
MTVLYISKGVLKEDYLPRQFLSLMVLTTIGGYLLYFSTASISYFFVFDHRLRKHPKFLKNQEWKEIEVAAKGVPLMGFLSVLCFLLEIRGYSRLLNSVEESSLGWYSIPISTATFILFTDCLIYWIHRGLHHPSIYKDLHKTHHLWKVPTPFASHAFHPIDGFVQSFPYHFVDSRWGLPSSENSQEQHQRIRSSYGSSSVLQF